MANMIAVVDFQQIKQLSPHKQELQPCLHAINSSYLQEIGLQESVSPENAHLLPIWEVALVGNDQGYRANEAAPYGACDRIVRRGRSRK